MTIYSTGKAARLFGVSIRTLQQWDRDGKLIAHRTPSNRRYYTDEQVRQWRNESGRPSERSTVAYYRVSSRSQKPDLKNQRLRLEEFCIARGLPIDEWIEEIGGGLNFKRPGFLKLFDRIIAGEISCLVIAHKDRLARFGFELLKHLCERHDCRLLVMNAESLSPEREMVEDLMAVTRCFSARLYGLRNYKQALKSALKNDQSA